ncbi:transcription initiation factor TFIID subunit 6 [Geosmithia morbida]|uniref:TBP-associated factor 6 n=1 Tax=Geosmithia morbida TaxID=1094350 RepID=A0A9P4YQ27_9HYPO|nr:transcription initiation factor TFIID subunit 6 [Geosmithia morbida]KAF4120660.1 transcription initiation factor TFIID subunit 6 [Geosmithia morbida]
MASGGDPRLLWNPENIKDVAESVGIGSLNEEALKALTQDVEYRIGQVIIEALRLMRAARRTTMTVNDVSLALRVLDAEPLYGYDSTRPLRFGEASLGPGQPLFYIEDEEVDFEKLINAPLPKVPRDMSLTAHWLAIEGVQPSIPQNPTTTEARSQDYMPKGPGANPALSALSGNDVATTAAGGAAGSGAGGGGGDGGGGGAGAGGKPAVKHIVSKELILYFDKIQAAILDDSPDEEVARLRQAALGSVRDDPGLHQLIPYFINFIMDRVTHNLDDTFTLKQMMELTHALIENKTLFLDPYASPLSAPVLTCLMARKLGSSYGTSSLSSDNNNNNNNNNDSDSSTIKEQYELRQLAASLVGRIARKYASTNTLLRPKLTRTCLKYLLDPTKPPAVLYGAVLGILEAGGPEAIRVLVLRSLRLFDEQILQPLREKSAAPSIDYEMLVQAILQAVASLADVDKLVQDGQHDGGNSMAVDGGSTGTLSESHKADLVAWIGPTIGNKVAGSGNRKLIMTILDARPEGNLTPDNFLFGEALSDVEDEVAHAVDEVVGEGEGEGELDAAGDDDGEGAESGGHAGALEVPSQQRGDEVGGEVGVGGARQGAPGDARPGRVAQPGLVELVDAQVGRDRAVEALPSQDLVALGRGGLFRREVSVKPTRSRSSPPS